MSNVTFSIPTNGPDAAFNERDVYLSMRRRAKRVYFSPRLFIPSEHECSHKRWVQVVDAGDRRALEAYRITRAHRSLRAFSLTALACWHCGEPSFLQHVIMSRIEADAIAPALCPHCNYLPFEPEVGHALRALYRLTFKEGPDGPAAFAEQAFDLILAHTRDDDVACSFYLPGFPENGVLVPRPNEGERKQDEAIPQQTTEIP